MLLYDYCMASAVLIGVGSGLSLIGLLGLVVSTVLVTVTADMICPYLSSPPSFSSEALKAVSPLPSCA